MSFDVFDTVLTRTMGRPSSLFLWLGSRLAASGKLNCSAEAFAAARQHAEGRARGNSPSGEVVLAEIYAELAWGLGMASALRDEIMAAELHLEEECIRVIPGAVKRVADARRSGARILFLSDMYLPGAFIVRQLQKQNLWDERDQCLVSGECRRSKRSGELFDDVLARENIDPTAVLHCGNDPAADMTQPRSKRIRTAPFLHANLNRYEEILESYSRDTQGLSSAFSGASRLARLQVSAESEHLAAIRDVSAGVAAPILTAYVLWILQQARRREINRLYFVSRDGQILLEIARRLALKIGFQGELRYLYGGRQAWFLPACSTDISRLEQWCFEDTSFLSVHSQLARAGLQPEPWSSQLQSLGFPTVSWRQNLTPSQRSDLRIWLRSKPVIEAIFSEASARREILRSYLAQELVTTSKNWALVDVGWRGRLQYFLEQVLADDGGGAPTGFYAALVDRGRYPSAGIQCSYFFGDEPGIGYKPNLEFLATPMEIFCTANHGVVLKYQEREGRIHPILREEQNSSAVSWGLETMRESILAFADSLHLDPALVHEHADLRPCVSKLLRTFWQTPNRAEALAWGQFPFEHDQAGAYQTALASPYSIKHIRRAYGWGGGMAVRHDSEWLAGSMAMTPPAVQKLITVAGRTGNGIGRAKRVFRRIGKSTHLSRT